MKKLITTAIVAGLLAAPLAAMAEISTYGSLRIGIASTSTTTGEDNATASGLNLRDGASRFGVKGFATPGLSGHIELGVSGAGTDADTNTDINIRIAKIDYAVTSSSTITVGRTWNPADIHNGWVTGGAEVQASAVGRAHQARTSGVRFNQSLGAIGSFDLMIAVTNDDEKAEAKAKDTANNKSTVTAKSNSIDQSILALTLTPVPDFKITLTYDSLESRVDDKDKDGDEDAENILGYGVGYKVGPVLLDLVLTDRSQAKAERSETYYGVSFGTEGQLYYFGYKTVENTNASGVKSDDGETGLTLGADIAFRGGLITVSYNDATNQGGTEGNNESSIGAGFVVNF